MGIRLPDRVAAAEIGKTPLLVNFYNGSPDARVEWRLDDGPWQTLEATVAPDPHVVRLSERDKDLSAPYRPLGREQPCMHLWGAPLPEGLAKGVHRISIRATDAFGATHQARRSFRVE